MSTRCNVVVSIGASKIYLYRHHDGYLAEAGADLALELKAVAGEPGARYSPEGMADRFLRSLMAKRYEKANYEKEPRAIWELTSDYHGDIERCYWIYFGKGGLMGDNDENFSVTYSARPRSYPELGSWINSAASKVRFEKLADFVAAVNRDRVESNRRIRELNAKRKAEAGPNAATVNALAFYEEYPMINLEKEAA